MKLLLFNNWHFIRVLRLVAGIWIGVSAIQAQDPLLGLIGTFLLWQAVSNTGCCGSGVCSVTETKANQKQTKEVLFEEVKTK